MLKRIERLWVYGAVPLALVLIAQAWILQGEWPQWFTPLFVLLPVYMLHQFDEWDNDRFRTFINAWLGRGREAMTHRMSFIINVPGVWGTMVVAQALALHVDPGWGLIAVWLMLVNAGVHLIGIVLIRVPHPGLMTAMTLFPLAGIWALTSLNHAGATLTQHLVALAIALAGHAMIGLSVKMRLASLPR